MIAYHGNPDLKARVLDELREHQAADRIMQGMYWDGDKGCAVGCLTKDADGGHAQYPKLWGIPEQLAHLEDALFELLPIDEAKEWPLRFMSAIPVGAYLGRVWDRWALWMLRGLITDVRGVDPSVEVMASLFARAVDGDEPAGSEWLRAARAAWAARAARAARVARVAWAAEAARAAEAAEAAEAARAASAGSAGWTSDAASELIRLVSA